MPAVIVCLTPVKQHTNYQRSAWQPVCREEVSQKRLNSIRGISNHDRLDEELYQDHETEEAKKARSAAHFVKRCPGRSCQKGYLLAVRRAEAPGEGGQGAGEAGEDVGKGCAPLWHASVHAGVCHQAKQYARV